MTYPTFSEVILPSIGDVTFRILHEKELCDTETKFPVVTTHVHGEYELYINMGGGITFLHEQDIHGLAPYDVIFIRPGDIHCCIYKEASIHEHYSVWFNGSSALSEFVESMSISSHIRLDDSKRLRALMELLEEDCNPYMRTAHFIELIALLGTGVPANEVLRSNTESKLGEVLAYVGEHYLEKLSSADIAARFFISESTLNRLFKNSTGMSPFKFIETKRLSYAEKLLREDLSVTDICFRSGFSDCSRFIIKFKEKFGMTPLRYRQAMQKEKQ